MRKVRQVYTSVAILVDSRTILVQCLVLIGATQKLAEVDATIEQHTYKKTCKNLQLNGTEEDDCVGDCVCDADNVIVFVCVLLDVLDIEVDCV